MLNFRVKELKRGHVRFNVFNRNIKINIFRSPICIVDKCKFIGLSISCNILNGDIQSSINTFNRKCNELRLDFSIFNSEIKSKLISLFCMDFMDPVYGTLVQFMFNLFILPGGKPFGLLEITIQNTLQLFTWYKNTHSQNIIVKSVIRSAVRSRYSIVGDKFRYFMDLSIM